MVCFIVGFFLLVGWVFLVFFFCLFLFCLVYKWFCKMHRVSLFYGIFIFLLIVECDAPEQCWWQVLQSLNHHCCGFSSPFCQEDSTFPEQGRVLVPCKGCWPCSNGRESCTSPVLQNRHWIFWSPYSNWQNDKWVFHERQSGQSVFITPILWLKLTKLLLPYHV